MNRILAVCFLAVAVLAIRVQWTDADYFNDFVMFPSLRAKRDMEMEEFFKDGNRGEAEKRALNRQRRSNEENMSEAVKRYRRSILEDDDEEDVNCQADEMENMKRSTRERRATYPDWPIRWKSDSSYPCGDETLKRMTDAMKVISESSPCKFRDEKVSDGEDYDIFVGCIAGKGNFAPIGMGYFKQVNFEQPGGKAGVAVVIHEMLHCCGLVHVQQEPFAFKTLDINLDCVKSGYKGQYKTKQTSYTVDPSGGDSTACSIMEYRQNAFLELGCSFNIAPKYPNDIPGGNFATNKGADYQEYKKIRNMKNNTVCTGALKKNESFGEACSILTFSPAPNPVYHELEPSGDLTVIKVTAGNAAVAECDGAAFEIVQKIWVGVPASPRCRKKGASRIVALNPNLVDIIAYNCFYDWTPDYLVRNVTGLQVYLDMSSATGGEMEVTFVCK